MSTTSVSIAEAVQLGLACSECGEQLEECDVCGRRLKKGLVVCEQKQSTLSEQIIVFLNLTISNCGGFLWNRPEDQSRHYCAKCLLTTKEAKE
jgi:ribosomal protein S27AE